MTRRPTRGSRGLALLLVSALASAACGSTVQQTGGDTLAGGVAQGGGATELGGDGLGGPALGGPATTGGPGTALGSDPVTGSAGAPGTGSGSSSNGTTSSGAGPAGGAPVAPGAPQRPGTAPQAAIANGPGVTAKTIALGITYCNDCAGVNAAAGAGGEDPGDTRRYYQAALDDVNARGGVLGRKLIPVFHEISASADLDVSAQAACETFTKDNKVLVMYFRGKLFYECAKKAGILVGGVSGGTGPLYEQYPNLFAPAFIRLERLYETTVRSMVRAGWQKPEPKWPTGKIGLITWDDNEYKFAMDKGYLTGLRKAGLKEELVRYIAVPQNANALADASAAISNAILAFREKGVDHVLIGDGPAGIFGGFGLTFLFLTNAKSQNYFPRYGFNSNNGPDFPNHPKDQLVGMLGIDSGDTNRANDEGIALNSQRERCFSVMQKQGLRVGQDQTQGVAALACEYAFFAEAVLKRATNGTTLPSMIAAGESLGTSYRSPLSYGNRITPGQHDGVALFRAVKFDEGCTCIKYTSKPFEP